MSGYSTQPFAALPSTYGAARAQALDRQTAQRVAMDAARDNRVAADQARRMGLIAGVSAEQRQPPQLIKRGGSIELNGNTYAYPNTVRGIMGGGSINLNGQTHNYPPDDLSASPKAVRTAMAVIKESPNLSVAQRQQLVEKIKTDPEIGPYLSKIPGWRQFDDASRQEFMQTAQANLQQKRDLHPDVPPEIWQTDPKTAAAVRNDDDYAVWKDQRTLKANDQKQRIEQAKPLFEAIQAAQDAAANQGWFSGSGEANATMEAVRMQARIADLSTGGSEFSDAIAGVASPQEMIGAVMRRLQAPAQSQQQSTQQPPGQPQSPQGGGQAAPPSPASAAGIADMIEGQNGIKLPTKVVGPNGRALTPNATPFSGGVFSVPDKKPQLDISGSARHTEGGKLAFDVRFGNKQFIVPPEIKAALEENPALAKDILSAFEQKLVEPPAKRKPIGRYTQEKAKPTIEWQGKSYEVSEVMAAAAKKHPELTQYFIGKGE